MNGYTTLAKSLASTGKYVLGRRQEERGQKQTLEMEAIRQDVWARRLKEQTAAQDKYRAFLLDQARIKAAGDLEAERLKQGGLAQRHADLMEQMRLNREQKQPQADWWRRKPGTTPKQVPSKLPGLQAQIRTIDQEIQEILSPYTEEVERIDP